ncbi:YfiR family protein [Ideonella sp.]|uniref:YfiR family protein n=1 Tax=Ideonella sp. TaxID=1929293 RepID=UPI0035AF36D1
MATPGGLAAWARWLAGASVLALAPCAVHAALPEPDLKAQVLVRSLLFVLWPAPTDPREDLVLCVPELHPWAAALGRQPPQSVNGRRLQLRLASTDPGHQCHVAVVGPEGGRDGFGRRPGLLRVGGYPGALDDGVMLNLQVDAGRVVFDVHLRAVREDGLDIDTRLLRLARFVQK